MRIAIVTPMPNQPSEKFITALLREQKRRFDDTVDVIVVDDSNGKITMPENWHVFDYQAQRIAMGGTLYDLFEQFHHSASCKQFGMWWAWKQNYDVVIALDYDCIVPKDFIGLHLLMLDGAGNGWENPLQGTHWYSRGFPYHLRNLPKMAHMGLWTNELDLYGTDRVNQGTPPREPKIRFFKNVSGYFPLSGMNVSFKRDAIPYMLFLPNFSEGDEKFTRHDDIWGGYIFQHLTKAKGWSLSYGIPFVFHDTVVVPAEDAEKEKSMIRYEEMFYDFIDRVMKNGNSWENLRDEARRSGFWKNLAPAFEFQNQAFSKVWSK